MGLPIFETPEKDTSVATVAGVLYLTAPLVEWVYYSTELARGNFPVDADSISLPLFRFMVVWLVGAPIARLIMWFLLRSYPGRVPLFGFNRERPVWSLVWSAVFSFLVYKELTFSVRSFFAGNPLDVAQSLCMAALFLFIRSSIVFGGSSMSKLNNPTSLVPQDLQSQ